MLEDIVRGLSGDCPSSKTSALPLLATHTKAGHVSQCSLLVMPAVLCCMAHLPLPAFSTTLLH